jgi:hypothetical protein
METSGSKWTVEHAANVGVQWDPAMKFPTSHPATLYGSLHSINGGWVSLVFFIAIFITLFF